MEELDVKGAFWLEGRPDEHVPGHLTFNAKDWPTLELLGSLHEDGQFFRDREPIRIHGLAGGKTLTLEGCSDAGGQLEIPGIRRERYHVWVVLSGAHLGADQLTQFTGVRCELSDLDRWVGKTGTVITVPSGFPQDTSGPITITHTLLDDLVGSSQRGEVEVSFPVTLNPDAFEAALTQRCSLAIKFAEPVALEDALAPCPELQDLVSIGIDSPAAITGVSLTYPDCTDAGPEGEVVDRTVTAFGRWKGDDPPTKPRPAHPATMLFTFDGIGGPDRIGRWLDVSQKYRVAIGPLMRPMYSPGMDVDIRFQQIVIGAEALGRIRLNDQNVILRDVLVSIASDAGDVAKSLVGDDINAWAKEIKDIRVENVVHRGLYGSAEAQRLYWLSESLYLLVVISLLRECGVSDDALSRIQQHERFMRVARRLAATRQPSPAVPEKVVTIDLPDEEWEAFDRAIREGRDG